MTEFSNTEVADYDWLGKALDCAKHRQGGHRASASARERNVHGSTPYGQRALEEELASLRLANEGQRNDTLNRVSFAVAGLIKGGELNDSAEDEVKAVAREIGLTLVEIDRTWQSAYKTAQPRNAPRAIEDVGLCSLDIARAGSTAADTKAHPARLQLIDILSVDLPEPQWVINGLSVEGQTLVLQSPPHDLKTWFLIDAAICVALKEDFLDQFSVTRGGRVLIYSPEGGPSALKQRILGLCAGRGIDPPRLAGMLFVAHGQLDLASDDDFQSLRDMVAEVRPAVLVLDPLFECHTADEDKAKEMRPVLARLRSLFDEHPALAIWLSHHTKKSGQDSPIYAGRGSSAIAGWADTIINLKRRGKDDSAPRRYDVVKQRDGLKPDPGAFVLESVPNASSDVTDLRLVHVDIPGGNGRNGAGGVRRSRNTRLNRIVQVVFESPGAHSADSLAKRFDVSERTIRRDIAMLAEEHRIQVGPRGALLPALVPAEGD